MSALATERSNRLAGAPDLLLEPDLRPSLAEARAWCKALAESHYENFHVATSLLPKRLRPHFHAVYAYCRVSDDLGDEVPDRGLAVQLLDEWKSMLEECFFDPVRSRHPVFVALQESIASHSLPIEPFLALLRAFRQDQVKTRFDELPQLLDYSRDSANPVGKLVLLLCGYQDQALFALSDQTCTGLQLANLWQDVREDLFVRDRIYLPADRMAAYGVSEAMLREGVATPQYRELMQELVHDARSRLLAGAPLIDRVDQELAATLRLFTAGGLAILRGIERIHYTTLEVRPVIARSEKLALLCGAGLAKLGFRQSSRTLRG